MKALGFRVSRDEAKQLTIDGSLKGKGWVLVLIFVCFLILILINILSQQSKGKGWVPHKIDLYSAIISLLIIQRCSVLIYLYIVSV